MNATAIGTYAFNQSGTALRSMDQETSLTLISVPVWSLLRKQRRGCAG